MPLIKPPTAAPARAATAEIIDLSIRQSLPEARQDKRHLLFTASDNRSVMAGAAAATVERARRHGASCTSTEVMTDLTVAMSGPIPRAAGRPRKSPPGAAPRVVGELAGAGSILVLDGYGCAYRARGRYITSEPDQIWMRDDSIIDIDRKIIARVACAALRHEPKIPGPIIERPRLGDGGQTGETARD